MLCWKILNSMPQVKFCKGSIVAARIYADVKGNQCSCGGLFTKRVPHPEEELLIVPKCAACEKYPPLFLIDVDAKDINGRPARPKIRNDQNGSRLDKVSKVLFTIERIQEEIKNGVFDVRKYDSEITKEAFIFKNYVKRYLEHHERRLLRDEITPKGLFDKKGLIARELLPFFGNIELSAITNVKIAEFKDLYVSKFRTRDLALGELKALLNQAEKDGMLVRAPKFDKIPRARMREEIIPRELAEKTIEAIDVELYRDMYRLMLIYPIRPGELRALMWKHIDFQKGEITVCQHFSKDVLIQGRKSVKAGKKESSITWEIKPESREIFMRHRSLNPYVFTGVRGGYVTESCLWHAWNRAREIVGHKYAPYECRHVVASDLCDRHNGNLFKLQKAGGWTNVTTVERYAKERSSAKELV